MRKISVAFLLLAGPVGARSQTFTMGVRKNLGDSTEPKQLFSEPLVPPAKAKPNELSPSLGQPESSVAYRDSPAPPETGVPSPVALTLVAVVLIATGTGAWTIRRRVPR